ncbi:MAG: CPBP family intramembrane metalloprotease [Bacteroidales bacterium]|nr:CPBP family intramembrane metalloprotease [Bacteroidales bacterium]
MFNRKLLSEFPIPLKLMLLGLLLILGMFIASFVNIILATVLGIDIHTLSISETNESILFAKVSQVISHLFIFIIPSIFFCYLIKQKHIKYLKLDSKPVFLLFIMSVLLIIFSLPIVDFLMKINDKMQFPEFMSGVEYWMSSMEEKTLELTIKFLKVESIMGLLLNLFVLALVPSIGEELLFRGVFQRVLQEGMKNLYMPIIISAFVFSFIHLQFYTFLPRFFLGLILAFIYWKTNNLWYPIIIHFVNNSITVLLQYADSRGVIDMGILEDTYFNSLYIVSISVLVVVTLLILINSRTKKKATD